MQALADFLARSVVKRPDDVQLAAVEGATSVLLELRVHPDDLGVLRDNRSGLMRAMQVVLNAASGPQKAILDLVDERQAARGEE